MNKKFSSVLWGILLILCAGILVASQLGMLGGMQISVWKVLATLVLLMIAIKSIHDRNFAGILFPVAIFCILFDEMLGITALTPWTVLLVALLLSIALSMIFKDWCRHSHNFHKVDWEKDHIHFERVIDEADGEAVYSETSFSGTVKYVNTDNFKKAYIKNSFGGTKMYFDKAVIQGAAAEIQVNNSFGGIELFIPKEWKIIQQANVSFGDIEEKNARSVGVTNKEVYLTGTVSFGAVTIIYT